MSLPSGYKRLEYIQSSSDQYIDTGFKPNQDTRVVARLSFDAITSGTSSYVFGAGVSSRDWMYELSSGSGQLRFTYGSNEMLATFPPAKPFTVDFNKNVITVDDTAHTMSAATFTGTYSMYIFDTNRGKAYREVPNVTLYSFWIYDNGTLVRDFIPCKNSSGTIGLWDDVNHVFYQNAGSGTFTAGPEVEGTHKTLINGTVRDIESGSCMVGGTGYAIKKGRALIDGTGYDVSFPKKTFHITYSISPVYYVANSIVYNEEYIGGNGELYLEDGESIVLYSSPTNGYAGSIHITVNLDGAEVYKTSNNANGNPLEYRFTPTSDCNIIAGSTGSLDATLWVITTQ